MPNYKTKKDMLEATPIGSLCILPAYMVTDNSVLVTDAGEYAQGHLLTWATFSSTTPRKHIMSLCV